MRVLAHAAYEAEPVGYPAHEAAALALGASLALLGRAGEAVPPPGGGGRARAGARHDHAPPASEPARAGCALGESMPEEAERHLARGLALARELGLEEWSGHAALLSARRRARAVARRRRARAPGGGPAAAGARRTLRLVLDPDAHEPRSATVTAGHDLELAAGLLGRARPGLARYPDAGVLARGLARAEHALDEARGGAGVLHDHLTAAEMRVLALLPTHLRVEEIGEALHLSKSTIKSHLGAIYRKLGVCRRSDAVTSALRHGILEAHD